MAIQKYSRIHRVSLIACLVTTVLATLSKAAPQTVQPAAQAQTNLLANADFARLQGGIPEDWTLKGNSMQIERINDGGPDGLPANRIVTTGTTATELSQTVTVTADSTFLFRMHLRSSALADVTIGQRRMAYTGEEAWLTIADLVKTDQETSLTVTLRLRGTAAGVENVFDLCEMQLTPATLPDTPARRFPGAATALVEDSAPRAFILYPAGRAEYAQLAAQVQSAVRDVSGITLPIATDVDATGPDAPVLQTPYRDAHLILLGRLGINRAFWPAYNRFLCATDGYYPGGDGYVVRTAANVLRNGKNHIILGGSTDTGAARAVGQFCEQIYTHNVENGTLTLPWLLEVELGGDCLHAFDADDNLWTTDPHSPTLPEPSPGYLTVVRWYMNAMGYYWSGRESYRCRAIEEFLPVLEDCAYTHHYIVEFLVRAYDMLDDSGLFSPEQTAAADALILKNFWEFLTGPDLSWMTLFSPPYENIAVRNRHSIAPWMADLMMADFLHDYFELRDDLADIVAYRRAEKHPLFRHFAAERWQPSLPNLDGSHDDEITATFFRYALHHERYAFFENGNARRALKIETLTKTRAATMDDHLLLGILAHYHADGRYKILMESIPGPQRLFQNRYVCGVRRYWPGPEVLAADPNDLAGVRIPPLQPHDGSRLHSMSFSTHRNPEVEPTSFFEYALFRDGFDTDSDLLKVSGFDTNTGILTDLLSHGQSILAAGQKSEYGLLPAVYFNLNGLSVIRTDRWMDDPKPYAGAARREWVAGFPAPGGGIAFTVNPFMTTSWKREILWLERGLFVVRDAVTALEDGTYSLSIGWFPNGAPEWKDGAWTGVLKGLRYRMTPLSTDFRSDDANPRSLRQTLDASLKQGQTVTATMVLQVLPTGQPFQAASLSGTETLILSETADEAHETVVVRWGGLTDGPLATDAAVTVLRPKRLELMQATSASMDGLDLLQQNTEASLRLDLETGRNWIGEEEAPPFEAQVLPTLRVATQTLLETLVATTNMPTAPESVTSNRLDPLDDTPYWRRTWSYSGLQRPRLITSGRNLAGEVYDLGREYSLGEIRAVLIGNIWKPTALPPLETRLDGPEHNWTPLPEGVTWRPGIKTGNYGEATPVAEAFQVLLPQNLRARYIRGSGAGLLLYYDADVRTARSSLKLEIEDFDADGHPEILVAPDIWPPFIRNRMKEDTLLSVLNTDGNERFQRAFDQNIQQVRLLRRTENDPAEVFVLTQDARLRILDGDGELQREDDLYAMHEDFDRVSGLPNTRHPAGGFTLPFSVGLWQPDAQGRRRTIVSRYGAYSFLDSEGQFEGLLTAGDYVLARLLPYGVDFNGDGREEQLCLGKWGMTHLDGDATPYIAEPTGAKFFPQVYQAAVLPGVGGGGLVDGTPIHLFETVPFGAVQGRPRYALVVRESVVALYDPLARKVAFVWTPPVSIRAATLCHASLDRLVLAVSTDGRLLWELTWQGGQIAAPSAFQAVSLPDTVNALAAAPDETLWIGGDAGLYRLENFHKFSRVATGAYQALCPLPGTPTVLIAATATGKIVRFDTRTVLGISAAEPIRWGQGWWYQSSATVFLQATGQQEAHVFVPSQNMTISEVWVNTSSGQAGTPILHLGIQGNGTNDFPDGNWIGGESNYAVSTLPTASAWNQVLLPGPAPVTAGKTYHIVVDVISADVANRSSIRFLNQSSLPVHFRPESGVYDTRVGRETGNAAGTWSRANAIPILAVDTSLPAAIGQPFTSGTSRSVYGPTRYGQIFTLNVPSKLNRFYLRKLGMKPGSSGTAEDDCRIKLRRVSDNALLVSEVLVEKTTVRGGDASVALADVTDPESVILENGEIYRIYLESTHTTVANTYTISAILGVHKNTDIPGRDLSGFQGTHSYVISSSDEQTWYKYNYAGGEVNATFELELVPVVPAQRKTLLEIR